MRKPNSKRVYKRIRTVPPDYWSPELREYFNMWCLDMLNGMRPYTPATVQTFERRFILYTRIGWEDNPKILTLEDVFHLPTIYKILSNYPVESYSNRHNMLYSLISFAKFLISLDILPEKTLDQLRKLRPRRVTPPRKTVFERRKRYRELKRSH